MKLIIVCLILTASLFAQAPAISVATTITANVGTLGCVGTPTVTGTVSSMHIVCAVGTTSIHTSDNTVPATPGTGVVISVSSGSNSVAWLLTKGNPTPDQWQVSVTDGTTSKLKTGSF